MATKGDLLFPNENKNAIHQTNSRNRYSNLNLNQNFKCLNNAPVQSIGTATFKTPNYAVYGNYEEKPHSWKKSSVNELSHNFLNSLILNDETEKEAKNHGKSSSLNANSNSTLSLHISAYENAVNPDSLVDGKTDIKNKTLNDKKQGFMAGLNIKHTFEFPRQSSEDDVVEPEVVHFVASQRLLTPTSSKKSPILRAGARSLGLQNAYLNFAKRRRLENNSSESPSSSRPPPTETLNDGFDLDDFQQPEENFALRDETVSPLDDLRLMNRSNVVDFTVLDQQMLFLHTRLRCSTAQNHFFSHQSVMEIVSGVELPYSEAIDNKLEKSFKSLWKLDARFYCSSCHKSLKTETSKCESDACKQKNQKNLIVCTADPQKCLLSIVKRFGDFSEHESGDDAYFKLTINTDGVVPKGHGQQELWPIYLQPANLPQHYKTLHESVALISVVADSGKPSDFAWAIALTPFIDWLRDQGNGLSLNISPTKQVKIFFEIQNLSADLAGVCHLFHFASWASSSQACMLCKVKPIYEHRAQRWGIIDEFPRRNNLNVLFDMLHRQGGFKEGATFWMNLVNVLNYRFDNLHKICEGICSTILKELYGDAKKMGNALKIRNLQHLEAVIKSISWPFKTKIIFSKLNSGTATEKLGSFLISVPLALTTCNFKFEFILWLLGLLSIIYSEFFDTPITINKKRLLGKLARLQSLLCGTSFSTLKFHYFFCHLFERTDLSEKVSTFIYESLNRYFKLKFDPNHQNGFTSAVMDKFLLERAVRYELVRRADYCPEVRKYLDSIDWRLKSKSGVQFENLTLKGEMRTIDGCQFFQRYLKHAKTFSSSLYNETNAKVVFQHDNKRRFGKIDAIFKRGDVVEAQIKVFNTKSLSCCFDSIESTAIEEANDLAQEIKADVFSLLDNNIQMGTDDTNDTCVTTNVNNIIGHCLEISYEEKKLYFSLAFKSECK